MGPWNGDCVAFAEGTTVYRRLKGLVVNYQLAPYAHLQASQLAHNLNVSVTPVREALMRLHGESLIASQPTRGFFIKPLDLIEVAGLYEVISLLLRYSITDGQTNDGAQMRCDAAPKDDPTSAFQGSIGSWVDYAEQTYILISSGSTNQEIRRHVANLIERTRFVRTIFFENTLRRSVFQRLVNELLQALRRQATEDAAAGLRTLLDYKVGSLPLVVREGLQKIWGAQPRRTA